MERKQVFVTRRIPEAGVRRLQEFSEVQVSPFDRNLSRDEIVEMAVGAEGLVSMASDPLDRALIDRLTGVRIIANYAVGFDNIDTAYAAERDIAVTNTPDVLTQATADIAVALILCVARRVVEGDRLVRSGKFKGVYPTFFLGAELENKVLGIYGMGRIGRAVAKKAVAFGLKIIYHDKIPCDAESMGVSAKYVSFDELLTESDFISVHAPLTAETHHRFTRKEFQRMKNSAYFINTARGPLVKEDDLVSALKQGWIAGAGLDVYEFEPTVHPGLISLDNAVLLPHIGSAAIEVREKMAFVVAANLIAYFKGETPPNRVN
jgi:glyoxylate reductase